MLTRIFVFFRSGLSLIDGFFFSPASVFHFHGSEMWGQLCVQLRTCTRRLNCSNFTPEARRREARALGPSLKSEDPAERGRSASKEVTWRYKDNPIRLWKMFLTKSETQWSVMRVLWLVKVFPWKNRSFSPSASLVLSLSYVPSFSPHTPQHRRVERFSCHQSHLDPCIPSSANCSSMGKYHSTFNGF